MSKICLFFATRDDLIRATNQVESGAVVKYARFGTITKLPPESFDSATQIPNLGVASQPSAVGCEKFLVCDSQTMIRPRQVNTLTEQEVSKPTVTIAGQEVAMDRRHLLAVVGLDRFAIDQLVNPDTITFTSGGLWDGEVFLHGCFATTSQSKSSLTLMKRFQVALRKTFVKVKAFYVGPQALVLLKNGKRLTISVQSPPQFDLKID